MPAFDQHLTKGDVADIIQYLHTLKPWPFGFRLGPERIVGYAEVNHHFNRGTRRERGRIIRQIVAGSAMY